MLKQPPAQHQAQQPGKETEMWPRPEAIKPNYKSCNKLGDKVAIITGGDSGIGRSIAYLYAMEGAKIVISYLNEHEDARETKGVIEEIGSECLTIAGDVGNQEHCDEIVQKTLNEFGHIDILVNNAAEQHSVHSLDEITDDQLEKTFHTNIYSYFFMTQAALNHLTEGSSIINTTSVTAYKGNPELIDYSATKGAIVAFTRSLALSLMKKHIRVNGVAPGPIWTPLIPATLDEEKISEFGSDVPMERVGQPSEVAPCYVFLASDDASYITGQILHPNGGVIING